MSSSGKTEYFIVLGLGFALLFLACAIAGFTAKWVTMVLLAGAIAVLLWKGKLLRGRMSWLTLAVALFVLIDGISTLYARAGKFALSEFLKVAASACIFAFFMAFEPKKQRIVGRCAVSALLASLLRSMQLGGFFAGTQPRRYCSDWLGIFTFPAA